MKITVKCFSQVKHHLGRDELVLTMADGSTTSDVEKRIRSQTGNRLSGMSLRLAVNRKYTPNTVELKDGDEVALIPPVQGG